MQDNYGIHKASRLDQHMTCIASSNSAYQCVELVEDARAECQVAGLEDADFQAAARPAPAAGSAGAVAGAGLRHL